jgi:hypothetical protein
LKQLKEWQSKFLELECVKDDLVDHQRSIAFMEQQLQEYVKLLVTKETKLTPSAPHVPLQNGG